MAITYSKFYKWNITTVWWSFFIVELIIAGILVRQSVFYDINYARTVCHRDWLLKPWTILFWKNNDLKLNNSAWISVFIPNTGKHGPEKTPYLDTFHVAR